MADYYKDERPDAVNDPGLSGSWAGGGGGGGSGGNGSGDGGLSGGWGGGGDGGGGGGGLSGGWGDVPDNTSYRYLKTSESGYLCCAGGRILTGTLTCLRIPALIVHFETDGDNDHSKCALFILTDSRKTSFKAVETKRETMTKIYGYWNFKPGKFMLRARWQGGHYDYGAIWSMRIIVYGVDLGWRRIPLTRYADIASVEITSESRIYVNHLAAHVDGNAPYMEE